MTCMICDEPVTAVDVVDGCLELVCSKCGHYRFTGSAIAFMDKNGWRFDVELSRRWLSQQQGSGTIPTIDSSQAARLIGV